MLIFYLALIENHENDDGFIRIFHKYKKFMYRIANSYIKDHHLSEDALQIAFVQIAKNMDSITKFDEEQIEIYVCKAARNSAFSILRKEKGNRSLVFSLDVQYDEISSSENIIDITIENELLNNIFTFIDSMKTEYRDILTLHFLHGLTFSEISIALNIPSSTVKYRFHKGQKLVVKKFKEYRR